MLVSENQDVKLRLGIEAYKRGEYTIAFRYLKDLDPLEENQRAIFGIVFLLNGQEEKGNAFLSALSPKIYEQENVNFKIAFGALMRDNPILARKWLEKADPKSPEAVAGYCFASYQLNSWKETIGFYLRLEEPYRSLDGYQGIVIDSYASLGDTALAEKMLQELLRKPPQPPLEEFPDYFRLFIEKKLNNWNRYYIAALFYKVVKKEPEKALEYFKKIQNPSFLSLIEMGELYDQLGKRDEASAIFSDLLLKSAGTEEEDQIKERILPTLAALNVRLGYLADALPLYEDFFRLFPQEQSFRIAYAQVLMQLGRYDLALMEFEEAKKSASFSPANYIDYLKCLAMLGHFDRVNSLAGDWIERKNAPLEIQLQLARLLLITKGDALRAKILEAVAAKPIKTPRENVELILFWLESGEYDKALNLAGTIQRSLETTPGGLLALANLYYRIGEDVQAVEYVRNAFALAPRDEAVRRSLESIDTSRGAIIDRVDAMENTHARNPSNLSIRLQYAQALLDLALDDAAAGSTQNIAESAHLKAAQELLEPFSKEAPEFPEAAFLLGKILYLEGKPKEAIAAYEQAIALNPAYITALQYLSLAYENRGNSDAAIQAAREAAKFDPSNAGVWLELGKLLINAELGPQALEALKNARKFAPKSPVPYAEIGKVYLKLNQPYASFENLEAAIALQPKHIETLRWILLALYHPNISQGISDPAKLEKVRLRYFDKLEALDAQEAKTLRQQLGIPTP